MGVMIDVLGALEVRIAAGDDVAPSGVRQRRLLTALVLHRDQPLAVDRLADIVWPDGPPAGAASALQSHVTRLRQRIPALVIEHRATGYTLIAADHEIDVLRFERAVAEALAAGSNHDRAIDLFDAALAVWRGAPYADLDDDLDEARAERTRLTELHVRATEERIAALMVAGDHAGVLAGLHALVEREPLRERPRELLMVALDRSGRRADALRVFDDYRRTLGAELGVDPSAHLRERHDALVRGDASADATSARDSVRAHRPAASTVPLRPVSSLVGRGEMLDALEAELRRQRTVSLIGPGGVGKTRLALELAHRLVDDFADGVRFVDLTPVAPGDVAAAFSAVVHVEHRAGVDPVRRLSEVLRLDRSLYVIDNCEHVIDEVAGLVEGLVASTEHLVVLATSRERLTVDGERVHRVDPLPIAGTGEDAVRLLLDRAAAAGARLGSDEATTVAAVELCRRLDGLPLAIELAATRLGIMTLDEVVDGLATGVQTLRGGRRSVPRHRTLDDALRWSYDLVDDTHRRALAALATFAAPTGADGVAAVAGISEAAAREFLVDLAEQSLVRRSEGKRFGLLETVRQFVRAHHADDARLFAERHCRHLVETAEAWFVAARTATDETPIRTIERLVPDLRQALDHALAGRDADHAVRLVAAVRYPAVFGTAPDLLAWGRPVAELAVAEAHPGAAQAYACAAHTEWSSGDPAGMEEMLRRSSTAAEHAGLERPPYMLAMMRGTLQLAKGDFAGARDANLLAADVARAAADDYDAAEAIASAAFCAAYAGDEVSEHVDAAFAALPSGAGVLPSGWTWYCTGEAALGVNEAVARRRLRRAVEHARAGEGAFIEVVAAASLTSLDVRAGDVERAAAAYERLLPMMLRGARAQMWTAMRSVAELLAAMDRDETAALVAGAVSRPGVGHEIVGDDRVRFDRLVARLANQLGEQRLADLLAEGATLDETAAVSLVLGAVGGS